VRELPGVSSTIPRTSGPLSGCARLRARDQAEIAPATRSLNYLKGSPTILGLARMMFDNAVEKVQTISTYEVAGTIPEFEVLTSASCAVSACTGRPHVFRALEYNFVRRPSACRRSDLLPILLS